MIRAKRRLKINDRVTGRLDTWKDEIDEVLESYADETGECYEVTSLESAITFAVDWTASNLAHRLRHLDSVAVVTASVDSLDPSPDVIAFADVSEAEDWVSDEVERRVQYQVDHSPYSVSEADRGAMTEAEFALFTITEEAL